MNINKDSARAMERLADFKNKVAKSVSDLTECLNMYKFESECEGWDNDVDIITEDVIRQSGVLLASLVIMETEIQGEK